MTRLQDAMLRSATLRYAVLLEQEREPGKGCVRSFEGFGTRRIAAGLAAGCGGEGGWRWP